jgi:hypothetical protein
MKKEKYVYVAFVEEYVDRNCVGIFTERKDAIEASKLAGNNNADVERRMVNPKLPKHPKGKYFFRVYVNQKGVSLASRNNPKYCEETPQNMVINNYVYLWAKSHKDAEKLARNIAEEYFINELSSSDSESSSAETTSNSTNDGVD